jgi:hypothetical protein
VCSCDVYRIGSTLMIPFNPHKAASQTEQVLVASPRKLRAATSPTPQRYQSLFRNVFDKKLDNRGCAAITFSRHLSPPLTCAVAGFTSATITTSAARCRATWAACLVPSSLKDKMYEHPSCFVCQCVQQAPA